MTLTAESRVAAAWLDPEFWPPKGLGCAGCSLERPVVKLGHTALGFNCLARWFPGWDDARIADWLIGQAGRAAAWVQGAEERKRKNWESLEEWLNN